MKTRSLSVLILITFIILVCCQCQENRADSLLQVTLLTDTAFDNSDLLDALRNTSKIPVFLPSQWPAATRKDVDTNFYLMTHIEPNTYDIEIYGSDHPVKINDEASYIKKNGRPLSESDYIGSVTGEKSADGWNNWKTDSQAESNDVFLTKQGWKFSYVGQEGNNIADQVRSALKDKTIEIAKKGQVKIVEGNRMTITASWQKDGCLYSCCIVGDMQTLIETVNSFQIINFPKQ